MYVGESVWMCVKVITTTAGKPALKYHFAAVFVNMEMFVPAC